MTRCDPGDIVHAPFPHVERAAVVRRPALLLRRFDTDDAGVGPLAWVLMITSAERSRRRGDLDIPEAKRLGLIIPPRVRTAKVATIAVADVIRVGPLHDRVVADARSIVFNALGVD